MRLTWSVAAAALLFSLCCAAHAETNSVALAATEVPIKLDGSISESAWQTAGTIADLGQQDPHPGEPTAYPTRVRFLRSGTRLYVAIEAFSPPHQSVSVHGYTPDSDLGADDTVTVVLDTFGDGRTGYLFRINAAGARQDGLITPGASDVAYDWDGLWDAATSVNDVGWTAEIAIDLRALRFDPHATAWGLNVGRFIATPRITLRWQGNTADASLIDLRRAGKLTGVSDLPQGLGIGIAPYALARARDQRTQGTSATGDVGGEVSWNITPELGAILTVNTDFAETEVDDRQINLTQFPLLFPEKRAFFLEGSNQFAFAPGLESNFVPFFSRRIGLVNNEVAPIRVGAKVLGHLGNWSIGALDVQTGDISAAPGVNMFAGRVTYDWGPHLRIGSLLTHGDPAGQFSNTLAAWDAEWRTNEWAGDKNLSLSAWYARSFGDLAAGRTSGRGLRIEYPNDLWYARAQVDEFGAALNPGLGFLPRPGTRQYSFGLAYQPRPHGARWHRIRQAFFEVFPAFVEDLDGRTRSWRVFFAPLNLDFNSGAHVETNWAPQFERLVGPFEITPGVVIATGSYRFNRYRVELMSSQTRRWVAGVTTWFGEFFDGRLEQWRPYVRVSLQEGHLKFELSHETNVGNVPAGRFALRLWSARATYAFNTHLAVSTLGQYDSEAGEAGFNTRLSWNIAPGRELFVVWNRSYMETDPVGFAPLQRAADEIAVKWRCDIRY